MDREALLASMVAMAFGLDFKPAQLDYSLNVKPPAPETPRKSGIASGAHFAFLDVTA